MRDEHGDVFSFSDVDDNDDDDHDVNTYILFA